MSKTETVEEQIITEEPEQTTAPVADATTEGEMPSEDGSAEKMGKVIAAARKTAREKGHAEGFEAGRQAALASMQEMIAPPENTGAVPPLSSPPIEGGTAPMNAPVSAGVPQSSPLDLQVERIRAQGIGKYGDDFSKKAEEIKQKIEINPTLGYLMDHAIKLGPVEKVYEIMSNPTTRAELLEDPTQWNKFLFSPPAEAAQPVVKTPPEPLDEIKSVPTKGKLSREERRRYVLQRNKLWRGK